MELIWNAELEKRWWIFFSIFVILELHRRCNANYRIRSIVEKDRSHFVLKNQQKLFKSCFDGSWRL